VLLAQRKTVYEKARQRNPLGWSGEVRNWQQTKEASLNPGKSENAEGEGSLEYEETVTNILRSAGTLSLL